jgi:tRNA pseudouridine32 synthase/23S rRNA pseudouridine746 synthase
MECEIIYRDRYMIAVNKPPGLLSVPGRGADKQDCMYSRLALSCAEVKVVHRLDCYTSGVMLFAVGIEMQRAISRLFHDRNIHKQYVAMVRQWFDEDQGVIDLPMRCDIDNRPRQIVDYVHGKAARTKWRVLCRSDRAVRLLLEPETGRTHQLRVHCAASGYPLVGDRLYADDELAEPRMLLHADTLDFTHPVSAKPVRIMARCEF